ncbi:Metalloendopeptidase [Aphelenchoides bicaudatus]|nr:Metalloendopeptidase [Aphelenchoides bicaudatus]
MRFRNFIVQLAFISIVFIAFAYSQKADSTVFFDLKVRDQETVLTPNDFAKMESLDWDQLENDTDKWFSASMYNPDLFQGDITNDVNSSTIELFVNGGLLNGEKYKLNLNAIRDRRQLWKNGEIPYALSNQYSDHSRAVIAGAMSEYSKHTCIKWRPRTQFDNDYVYILPERGCYSMVGRTGGRQVLSLGQGCIQKGIIMHEMMHAVGFFHEQSRPDRDSYVQILWHNIQPGMQNQFDKYSSATVQTFDTTYDFASILHYDAVAFSRNGQPTILPRTQTKIGQRGGFSSTDSYKINRLYECSGPTETTATAVTQQPQITTVTYRKLPTVLPTILPAITTKCVDKRPDCKQLYKTGWCSKNRAYMNENCCNICENPPAEKEIEGGTCEDLRVDCLSLVKQRYCLLSPRFSKEYCSKSCGFCPPLEKEIVDIGVTYPSIVQTTQPPIITTTTPFTTTPQTTTLAQLLCRDKNFKCVQWKKQGYCTNPIYYSFMKNTCPFSCKFCSVLQNQQN